MTQTQDQPATKKDVADVVAEISRQRSLSPTRKFKGQDVERPRVYDVPREDNELKVSN